MLGIGVKGLRIRVWRFGGVGFRLAFRVPCAVPLRVSERFPLRVLLKVPCRVPLRLVKALRVEDLGVLETTWEFPKIGDPNIVPFIAASLF